jgi:hypothetical protein
LGQTHALDGCTGATRRGWRVSATGAAAVVLASHRPMWCARWRARKQRCPTCRAGVTRWWRAHLARATAHEFGVAMAERGAGDALRRLGFRRPVPRPRHPGQDAVSKAFSWFDFRGLASAALPERARARVSSGSGTGPVLASRALRRASGPPAARPRRRRAIGATAGPTRSAPPVWRAISAPGSRCRPATATPQTST